MQENIKIINTYEKTEKYTWYIKNSPNSIPNSKYFIQLLRKHKKAKV